jgi:hypothetical protein
MHTFKYNDSVHWHSEDGRFRVVHRAHSGRYHVEEWDNGYWEGASLGDDTLDEAIIVARKIIKEEA